MAATTAKKITLLGMLIAISVVVQYFRLLLPLPAPVSLLISGSILNACLIASLKNVSLNGSFLVSFAVPIIALLHQAFLSPLFIFPAILANVAYSASYAWSAGKSAYLSLFLPALLRALSMYGASLALLESLGFINEQLFVVQLWICAAQFATGVCGAYVYKKTYFLIYV